MIVDLEIPPVPKPIITPMLVTIAEVAPKLTVGSLKAIICHLSNSTCSNVREGHRFGTRIIFSDRRILASSRASRHAS
jgi:hypothetical protein